GAARDEFFGPVGRDISQGDRHRRTPLSLYAERGPATASGAGIGILDDKSRTLEVFRVVDLGAFEIGHALRVNQQRDDAPGKDRVGCFGSFVEGEAILEAGASAASD